MIPWITKHYNPSQVMFFQDSAPAQGYKIVQDFLHMKLPLFVPKDIWPSKAPNLNPCEFWLLGVVEGKTNVAPHSSVNALKTSITKACWSMGADEVRRACSTFRGRI